MTPCPLQWASALLMLAVGSQAQTGMDDTHTTDLPAKPANKVQYMHNMQYIVLYAGSPASHQLWSLYDARYRQYPSVIVWL